MVKDKEGRTVPCVNEIVQLDELKVLQIAQVIKPGDSLTRQQQDMLVDNADTAENSTAVFQQNISDKSKSEIGYWAKDVLVAGTAGLQDAHDVHQLHQLHCLHHHQLGEHHEDPLPQPGHMVHEDIGHVKDIPGKDNLLCNLIVSVTGKEKQAVTGEQGVHGGGQCGTAHHEGGASACLWDGGVGNEQAGQDAAPGCCDGGPVQVQSQGAQSEGKQAGGDRDQAQVHGGGGGGGREVHGGNGGVLARVRNGFGGETMKRAYWRKKLVPDGLVQQRIFEFSTQPKDQNSGVVGQNFGTSTSTLMDRKRK